MNPGHYTTKDGKRVTVTHTGADMVWFKIRGKLHVEGQRNFKKLYGELTPVKKGGQSTVSATQ